MTTLATPLTSPPDANPSPRVVPSLQEWHGGQGTLALASGSTIHFDPEDLAQTAALLAEELLEVSGLDVKVALQAGTLPGPGDIHLLRSEESELPLENTLALAEGYTLEVGTAIVISAPTGTGVYWGTRTLLQTVCDSTQVPRGLAVDWPNYAVRGFMLDVGRQFCQPEFVKDYIKFLSWYKLNTFLIHLSDNEIVKDTKRPWSEAQHGFRLRTDNPAFAGLASEDGSYTAETWEEFESLAARHHVTLVPEIDVPAHSRAIISWKPELGLNSGDSDMLDLSNPATLETVREVFSEFAPWFQGPSLHFGADEYERGYDALYKEFFNNMAAHIRGLGKDPMAWGSLSVMATTAGALEDNYSRDVTICSWNNQWYGPDLAIRDGYKVINTNDALLYIVPFATYYSGKGLDGRWLFENWEPHVFADDVLIEPGHPQLLGAASALWNDLVLLDYDEHAIHSMVEPSMGVLAQKMWTGTAANLSFEKFSETLNVVRKWPGSIFIAS